MKVAARTVEADFDGGHAAQRVAEGRVFQAGNLGVRDNQCPAGQLAGMARQEVVERFGAHLLLTFDEENQIAGQGFAGLQPGLDRVDVGEVLAFVVADSAGIDVAADPARFEGRRGPEFHRIGRLHVVVSINEKRRLVGVRLRGSGEDDRVSGRRADFRLEAGRPAAGGQPLRTRLHVRRVLGLGADPRNPHVIEQLGNKSFFVLRQISQDVRGCHGASLREGRASGNPVSRIFSRRMRRASKTPNPACYCLLSFPSSGRGPGRSNRL
jgi:hypothetical protein